MDLPDDAVLGDRYARPVSTPRTRTRVAAAGIAAAVVAVAFILWVTLSAAGKPSAKDIGFDLASSARISADFELTRDPSDPVRCGIEALNESYAVVGYTEVSVPPAPAGPRETTAHTVPIRTTNQANSAQVVACWVEQPAP